MTQDEIYELARQAGFDAELMKSNAERGIPSIAEIFAKLVAAKEREACAKDCEDIDSSSDYYGERVELVCAEVIRARGK